MQGGNYSGSVGFIFNSDPDSICVSINQITKERGSLQLFPVPVIDFLNIKFNDLENSNVKINIYDVFGRTIYKDELYPKENTIIKINLSDQNPGLYLFTASTKYGEFRKKIMIGL